MNNLSNTGVMPNELSAVLANNRKIAQKYGPYFGQMLFTLVSTNPDLKWKEDCIAGRQTLRNEVKAFVIKGIDVCSVSICNKDIDGNPKIVLNKDTENEMVCPMAEPEFTKATRENVAEAIERAGKTSSKPMFFSAADLPELIKLVRTSNQMALDTYEKMAQKMLKLAETTNGIIEAGDRLQAEYLRQCGVNTSEVDVHLTVEVSE